MPYRASAAQIYTNVSIIEEAVERKYDDRLKRLNLWSLEERRNRTDLLEMFRIYKGLSAPPFHSLFKINSTSTTRSHTAKIVKTHAAADVHKFFFFHGVVHYWNNLAQRAVDSESINFKSNIDRLRRTKMRAFHDV